MIADKSQSHIARYINDLHYITGESQHKKHPEKIYRVLDNLLPSEPDALGDMELHAVDLIPASTDKEFRNQNTSCSPSPEHTQFYDIEDWQKLWQEFAEEFEQTSVLPARTEKVRSCPTNLAGSKYSVWLHTESKGEVPLLHAAVCRMDENGNINNDHNIHLRAQRAAERVAKKTRLDNGSASQEFQCPPSNSDCMDILKSMQSWSWEEVQKRSYTERLYST